MSVLDVLYMTIAIPFIFESFEYKDWRYTDGAFIEATPCAPFLNKEDVLGIHLVYKSMKEANYISKILQAILRNRYKYTNVKHLNIDIGDSPVYNFKLSMDDKIKMYTLGYSLTSV